MAKHCSNVEWWWSLRAGSIRGDDKEAVNGHSLLNVLSAPPPPSIYLFAISLSISKILPSPPPPHPSLSVLFLVFSFFIFLVLSGDKSSLR